MNFELLSSLTRAWEVVGITGLKWLLSIDVCICWDILNFILLWHSRQVPNKNALLSLGFCWLTSEYTLAQETDMLLPENTVSQVALHLHLCTSHKLHVDVRNRKQCTHITTIAYKCCLDQAYYRAFPMMSANQMIHSFLLILILLILWILKKHLWLVKSLLFGYYVIEVRNILTYLAFMFR